MRKILAALVFAVFSVSPAFAWNAVDFSKGADLRAFKEAAADAAAPLPLPPQAGNPSGADSITPVQQKEWTVMVFMNGSNNLADWEMENLREMSGIGTTDSVNVVIEASIKTDTYSQTQRMLLLPGDGREINSVVYRTWLNRDMGDWRNAADFVKWAKASFPAKRYIFIMENHGGGFIDETITPKASGKGISYDELSNNYIKVPELPLLFREAGYVDMFIMNACEMQMAEVAYEIGGNAGVIITSEEVDNSFLFQYKERLEYLNKNTGASAEKIAADFIEMRRVILTPGNEIYMAVQKSTLTVPGYFAKTLSAVRTTELKNLPATLDRWVTTVMAANEPDSILYAIIRTVRFGVTKPRDQAFSQFTDLGHFANLVASASKKQEVRDATAELETFLAQKLIIANAAVNVNLNDVDYSQAVKGLGIKMIPMSPVNNSMIYPSVNIVIDTKYEDLLLSKACLWDEFLKWAGEIYYRPY